MRKKLLFFFMTMLFSVTAYARDAVFMDGPVVIKVDTGKITEVVFPSEVASITKAVPSDVLQIEVMKDHIYFLPLKEATTDVYVLAKDGVSYPLALKIDGSSRDTKVVIRGKEQTNQRSTEREGKNFTVMAMRKLLNGEDIPGANRIEGVTEVYNDGKMKLILQVLYELETVRAMVMEAQNLLDTSIVFPIQEIQSPNLMAIASDKQVIEGRGKTKVYMIVGR